MERLLTGSHADGAATAAPDLPPQRLVHFGLVPFSFANGARVVGWSASLSAIAMAQGAPPRQARASTKMPTAPCSVVVWLVAAALPDDPGDERDAPGDGGDGRKTTSASAAAAPTM